ncbi:16S rRNA (cytosine(967)-C(5))-methyltransferase RsmB [Caldisalinibacter kiritimatiensis]|uniref:16S rRNA (cytosine(967)-C(5))-methyltransferase n=1 Tax=Caldisalinibacter kiritimatiensis TaxID=1304284 RepID=R1AXC9_9FIRM|nr:16S rRNA (cytosine(967)-C(5))-methyltransferase RsmB [Caldisalinibacter kiritimatiensis]EOD01317.1 Ribosomal RNA small subunit methyltransferase B [Caldisalinibacter kiritimatiensis]
MKINAREIAIKVLYEVNEKGAYSNISINRNVSIEIEKNDEDFIRELVYGVLENKLYIDWVIKSFSKVKFKKIAPMIKQILRIGVYQLLFMDKIPDSAAVNESVNLAKKYGHRKVYGFVNGVLRNIARNKNNIELPDKKEEPIKYLSIKYSHPEWLIKRWIKVYGFKFTKDLCKANNETPKLNIRVNTLKISRNELAKILIEKGFDVERTKYATDGLIVHNPTKITGLNEFRNGLFQIQDESSMLVAQILKPEENSLVIDVCSAPGGKTTHIAQKMNNKGKIIARDIYRHKLNLVNDNAKRLGIKIIETQQHDALKLDDELLGKADYCLVDAPCSGLGLIRRKPEIKWNKKEDDIHSIIKLQYDILVNSSKYLKQGGILVYSTCTIEKEENIKLINRFLKNNSQFKLIGFDNMIENCENFKTSDKGYIEIYPNINSMDGFFICKMVKM